MTLTRRELLAAGAAAAATQALPATAFAATGADAAAEALLSQIAESLLADMPETASGLGIDTGKRAALKSRLGDRSPQGQAKLRQHLTDHVRRLKAIDTAQLSTATRTDVDVAVSYTHLTLPTILLV